MNKTFMYYDFNSDEYIKYVLKRKKGKKLSIETEESVLKDGITIDQFINKLNSVDEGNVLDFTGLMSLYNPHHNNTYGNLYNQVQSIFSMYDVISRNSFSKDVIAKILRNTSKGNGDLVDIRELSNITKSIQGNSILMETINHDFRVTTQKNRVINV